MPRLVQLTSIDGKPADFDAKEIYAIEKTPTGGSTLILTVIHVLESYDEIKRKVQLASAAERSHQTRAARKPRKVASR